MVAYRRYYIKGGTWFFTVNLKDRRSMHLTENIELLRYSVAVVKQHRPFIIDAWVVLPEHLHCIWTLPHNDDDFSSRWRDIKGCFSRTLKRQPSGNRASGSMPYAMKMITADTLITSISIHLSMAGSPG
ncbi:transposase-like protein [Klebsiella pneumoniae subsp. ozaenae]|uniref:Transposase-like protein n=1 Tax=Klebsiella pneumoniae subsp. ozaenae TaxID=574 RepID=A0A377Z2H7_KLEPO|nr:transposase-like protein [Klebsiella pneumoniae subsp. ozaenae]